MKIGILTFHRCINYGSYWQSRCLAEGLRSLGHEVVILDHRSRAVDLAEWRCALHPVPTAAGAHDRARYRRKLDGFLRAVEQLPLSPRFPLDEPTRLPECDAIVVGSDEVWNLSHPWYGGCPLFYGEGIRGPRLVAYAASFGHHDAGAGMEPAWSRRLSRFERIAVRDRASRRIVADSLGVRPPVVLDPCLQFPEVTATRGMPEQPYIAVYGHDFTPAFALRVQRVARDRSLPLVSIGYRNDWADRQWIEADPGEFATFMAGAEAVATNFFHGCVFALRHGRPFACEPSWYRGSKLRCLMADVGAHAHLVDDPAGSADFDRLLSTPPAAAVQQRIANLRQRSRRYLQRALAPRLQRA